IPLTLLLGIFQSSLSPECESSQGSKVGIIYARVSTKAQAEEGYSLPAQIDMLKKIAERESIKVLKTLEDGGKTGRNLNRENLWKILQYAENRKISYLLVIEIDRIGRNSIENLYFMNLLKENGVKIRTKDGEIDLNKITDLITATIKSLASQIEINNLSERTQRGKIKKWKGKGWIRPKVPLGYETDNSWIKKISQYSQLIKDIYDLFERYGDYSKVQRTINKNFKELPKDRPLTVAQIKRILSDPVYIGKPQYGNEAVDSPELAFIDEYTVDKAQKIKEKIKKRHDRNKNKKVVTVEDIVERVGIGSAESVLPIAVLCTRCGNIMVKNGTRKVRNGWVYNYRCPACGKQSRIPTGKQLDELNWTNSGESSTTSEDLLHDANQKSFDASKISPSSLTHWVDISIGNVKEVT
ncbi:recombinase family protein, partial [bacterium]|nr:recombinase family protein [bacterium]